jgi:ABC-type branched-subunit amino acid transport system substrate-binding protein
MIGGSSVKFFYPVKRYMFSIWGLYDDYGRMMVDYVANSLKMPNARIAHIQQDDETGHDNHRGILLQLKKYPGMKLVSHEKFKRGTVDVSAPVANMKRANTEVVLISPIFVSSAMIAKEMYKIGWKPPMVMNATSATQLLIKLGGKAVEGAYVQFTNNIMSEDHIPGVKEYKDLMKKYFPKSKASPSTYGISGFYEAKIAFEGIKRAGRNLTREGLVDAMETIKNFDTQGMGPVSFSSTDHMGNHSVRWFKVQNGKFVNLSGWTEPK